MRTPVVIVGTGQAGFQAAASLRAEGYDDPVVMIGDERHHPYQRPPLSKAFMTGKQDAQNIFLRPSAFYQDHRIDLLAGEKAVEIDRANRRVRLASGSNVAYQTLVLATGARVRTLPIRGAELDGACYLRTVDDAIDIRTRLGDARNVVVIGGGFIGLELASSARSLGKAVTVVELQPRLMPRMVAPLLSEFDREVHSGQAVEIVLGAAPVEIRGQDGRAREVRLSDGTLRAADVVAVGIGVLPNFELARDAGLAVSNGIAVDAYLRTGDENIYAIGDCAEHPNVFAAGRVRLESVQNAVDQGRSVAAAIAGRPHRYESVPWFWTDQFDVRLQMVGLSMGHDRIVTRGDPQSRKFSVFYFREGRLIAIDSINRPADHMIGRKLLASGVALTPDQASDESLDLKRLPPASPSM